MSVSTPGRSQTSWMTRRGGPCSGSADALALSKNSRGATSSVPTSMSTGTCSLARRLRSALVADVCGIAGCYQQADGQKLTDIMIDRIEHRGPDAGGSWSHEDDRVAVQLGHRRLSIIDLSAAADQPLRKNGLTLVYNGELYNYRVLRAELAARGVRFVTSSDTEVVLEAWREWGPGALRRFRGMFAFALLEERTGDLILARDPLGIKPLYYRLRDGGV